MTKKDKTPEPMEGAKKSAIKQGLEDRQGNYDIDGVSRDEKAGILPGSAAKDSKGLNPAPPK